ncbi:4Fe-4S binding protein [Desulfosarcina sp. BuS5]|uniref:4Fe-4S binding protein n=1 Tax=Desulfosarcina sp. BuS5 TaxID=933262 RepID=UPI0018DDE4DC|nr:4Fe-4S binding protein [Desulfosarcina sp. BuS5]
MQTKKSFTLINYEICSPKECNPDEIFCGAVLECSHKIIKQIDGVFEPPILFQDMCMGCWDCIEACQLDAIQIKHIS